MKFSRVSCVFVLLLLLQDVHSLTMQNLLRKPKKIDPRIIEENEGERKSFVRNIGNVAGRPIVPRRWITGDRVEDILAKKNRVAFPSRQPYKIGNRVRFRHINSI